MYYKVFADGRNVRVSADDKREAKRLGLKQLGLEQSADPVLVLEFALTTPEVLLRFLNDSL